jgi:hypothetical protein
MAIMKSPFKFLDSYTKDDREIFFGRDSVFPVPETPIMDFIPLLQGLLSSWRSYSHWTLSNALIFCAYSAYKNLNYSSEKLIEKAVAYFHTNKIKALSLTRPVRAIYYKTGQRPVYKTYNDYKPCKGEIR